MGVRMEKMISALHSPRACDVDFFFLLVIHYIRIFLFFKQKKKESRKTNRKGTNPEESSSREPDKIGDRESEDYLVTTPLPPTPKIGLPVGKPLPAIGSISKDTVNSVEGPLGDLKHPDVLQQT